MEMAQYSIIMFQLLCYPYCMMLLGCLCVAASFPFIFNPELGTDPLYYTVGNNYWSFLYYAPFIVIFQFGWASTQISHLSLIPSLATNEHDKVGLNSIRYGNLVLTLVESDTCS